MVELPCVGCDMLVPRSLMGEHTKRCSKYKAVRKKSKFVTPSKSSTISNINVPITEMERTLKVVLGACRRLHKDVASYEIEAIENKQFIDSLRQEL